MCVNSDQACVAGREFQRSLNNAKTHPPHGFFRIWGCVDVLDVQAISALTLDCHLIFAHAKQA